MTTTNKLLNSFVTQSNLIEGMADTRPHEIEAHSQLLALEKLTIPNVELFVSRIQPNAVLRDREGLNVRVGNHFPPPGGRAVSAELEFILSHVNSGEKSPWKNHCAYETLHPFTDGNGRSGRAIWLWQMTQMRQGLGRLPPLDFLHAFYYQTLESQGRKP